MKNQFFTLAFLIVTITPAFSQLQTNQLDITTTPLSSILIGRHTLNLEKGFGNKISFEASILYNDGFASPIDWGECSCKSGFGFFTGLRYYVQSGHAYDSSYFGVYFRDLGDAIKEGVSTGIHGGYKLVFDNKLIFDTSAGFGLTKESRSWSADIFMKFSVGYRFFSS